MYDFQEILQKITRNTLTTLNLQAVRTPDSSKMREKKTLSGHTSNVLILAPLPDGRLASGSEDGAIKVWNVQMGECLHTLSEHSSHVCILAPLPDGRLASGSDDGSIKIWNVQTGECLHSLSGHSSDKRHCRTILALVPLPDGSLVSGSKDGTIKVWNIQTGECLHTLSGDSRGRGTYYNTVPVLAGVIHLAMLRH